MRLQTTKDSNSTYNFNLINQEIETLKKAVQNYGATSGIAGAKGDIRFVKGSEDLGYLEYVGKDDVYTSFTGCFRRKQAGYQDLRLRSLEVDHLYATQFTARQINAMNGDFIFSDSAVVQTVRGSDITFADPNNVGVCPFAANDLIVARTVNTNTKADIIYVQATVSSVSGNTATITYTSSDQFIEGQTVVRVGNTTDATRMDSIYISTNLSYTPYLDIYDNISSFGLWAAQYPQVRIGKLTGITDADFGGALTGYGIYTQNAYLKGKIYLANNGSISLGKTAYTDTTNAGFWIGDSNATATVNPYFYFGTASDAKYIKADLTAGTLNTFGIDISAGAIKSTTTMTYDRGVAGTEFGYWLGKYGTNDYRLFIGSSASKYFKYDNTDLTLAGGTIITTSGSIGGWTLGATSLTSTNIGLHSGASAQILLGHATDYSLSKIGLKNDGSGKVASGNFSWDTSGNVTAYGTWTNSATITGGTIQTDTGTGQRVVIAGATNDIKYYNSSNNYLALKGNASGSYTTLDFLDTTNLLARLSSYVANAETVFNVQAPNDSTRYIQLSIIDVDPLQITFRNGANYSYITQTSPDYITISPAFKAGNTGLFAVNSSGQITLINNVVTSKFVPISNGTHYEPRVLAMSDLPALTANRVLLSDASGYVTASAVTNTTLGYLDATSSIQTQINAKPDLGDNNTWTGSNTFQGDFTTTDDIIITQEGMTFAATIDMTGKSYVIAGGSGSTTTNTINGGTTGKIIYLENASSSFTWTIGHMTGNVRLNGGANYAMGQYDTLMLIYNGTYWLELARSNNA